MDKRTTTHHLPMIPRTQRAREREKFVPNNRQQLPAPPFPRPMLPPPRPPAHNFTSDLWWRGMYDVFRTISCCCCAVLLASPPSPSFLRKVSGPPPAHRGLLSTTGTFWSLLHAPPPASTSSSRLAPAGGRSIVYRVSCVRWATEQEGGEMTQTYGKGNGGIRRRCFYVTT